jgi:hypothetical protein
MIHGLKKALVLLLACSALAWSQKLSEADAQAMIEKTRQKALAYSGSLPDFVCTEIIHRYSDVRQRAQWSPLDKLTIRLSYFQQTEDHKLMLIDDKPTSQSYLNLAGATGVGEFGTTLYSIFDPNSQATFHWETWKNIKKRRTAVYDYMVLVANSRYILVSGVPGNSKQAIVGYHGVLEIDAETSEVLHFTYLADHIPKDLIVEYALTAVDYDLADVGGRPYLLPARSQTEMRSPKLSLWNQTEFRDYRKFSTESTITFGDGK